jgi:hypothetical protein
VVVALTAADKHPGEWLILEARCQQPFRFEVADVKSNRIWCVRGINR